MILYPAIDIYQGKAVRLRLGDFADSTVYKDDPLVAAQEWISAGARALHVVDLDGAKEGAPRSLEHLERIAGSCQLPVQYGGGLRKSEDLEAAFQAGATRVILGTAAYRDLDLLDGAVVEYGDRVIVSVDGRGGKFATSGWTETTDVGVTDVISHLIERGVRSFVYTDIDRDGMLSGPDLAGVEAVADAVKGRFIYSGGIGNLEHLKQLAALRRVNMSGVIAGKALYECKFTVAQGQATLEQSS